MILIYVSLILVAAPTDRVLRTIVTPPHLNPSGGRGLGYSLLWPYTPAFTFPKMHLICTPKFCISIVFNFSAKFWGANKVHFGKCGISV